MVDDKEKHLFFPRAWLYARTSSGNRAAIEDQLRELTDWAEQKGYSIVGSSFDIASDNTIWRPGLFVLMHAVRHGNVDLVIVANLSRLAIRKNKLCKILQTLQKYRTSIQTSAVQLGYDLHLHGLDRILTL